MDKFTPDSTDNGFTIFAISFKTLAEVQVASTGCCMFDVPLLKLATSNVRLAISGYVSNC